MQKLALRAMSSVAVLLFVVGPAMAQAEHAAESASKTFEFKGLGALAVGLAAAFAALGDGRAVAAACEGTARNPGAGGRIFTMMLLGLALIETLVLVTFAAAFSRF